MLLPTKEAKAKPEADAARVVKVDIDGTIADVVRSVMKKVDADLYVIKLPGREEYLLGGYKMFEYKCVRSALSRGAGCDPKDFTDVLVGIVVFLCNGEGASNGGARRSRREAWASAAPTSFVSKRARRSVRSVVCVLTCRRGKVDMLWHSPEASNKFMLKIVEAHAVPGSLGRLFGIGVKAAIYHGEEMLCKPEVSRYIQAVENPSWYVHFLLFFLPNSFFFLWTVLA